MTDKPKTIRDSLGPSPKFADALAAHLADVRNADEAHRIIRSISEQKLEALTRIVCEMHGQIEALVNPPEPSEPCESCGDPECPA